MSPAEQWLRANVAAAPQELLSEMLGALEPEEGTIPETLARAGLRLYARVAGGSGGREDALPLLAGDALITHAFEAQAQLDPAGLEKMAIHWGPRGAMRPFPG